MHVLYATDGSEQARGVGIFLNALKFEPADSITVLTVEKKPGEAEPGLIMMAALEDLATTPAAIQGQVRQGDADEEILRACKDLSVDLLAVGAKGRSRIARFLLGSVTARVVRYAPCSVLVVRPATAPPRKAVLAFDGTPNSRAAALALLGLPLPETVVIKIVTVLPVLPPLDPPPPYQGIDESVILGEMSTLEEKFTASGYAVTKQTLRGDPASSLLDFAEEENPDLIVVGSHGSSLPDRVHRFLLGSVSEKIARYASCSVLVVRPFV